MKEVFGVMSTVVGLITYLIGIRSILRGEFKPQRVTRFLYALIGIIFFSAVISQKGGGALLAGTQAFGGIVIFLLSLKYGVGGRSKSDMLVLTGALLAIVIWRLTSNPTYALVLSILTDIVAFWPTAKKIWHNPETEDWKFYSSDILAGSLSLLSIPLFTFPGVVYPLYIFLLNLFATCLIVLRGRYLKIRSISIL